jgi:hypothetical protein
MEEKQTPSIEMLEWHHDASEKLTDSQSLRMLAVMFLLFVCVSYN